MSEQIDMLLDGLAAQEEAMGTAIVWAGNDYPCSGGPEFGGKQLDIGGFKLRANVTLIVRTAVFPAGVGLPKEKQTIGYRNAPAAEARSLRIDSLTMVFGVALVLECNDPSAGA